ncbi:MAG TPA: LamG-like jellyroll fold domain-containing protein, partial [Candidatus Dormibacteraeota bacterium]|nr:LamG-like jellyroll fold domain-containing protein [Candidatus Dormibacteraeota bacterium]
QGYYTLQRLLGGQSSTPPTTNPTPTPPPPTSTPTPPPPTSTPTPTPITGGGDGTPGPITAPPLSGTQIYSDNFQADAVGSAPAGWTPSGAGSDWTVQSESGIHVLSHSAWTGHARVGNANWAEYSFSAAVKPSAWASEDDGLMFGWRDGGHYSLDIVAGNRLVLGKWANGTWTQLASTAYAFSSRWYTLRVDMSGGALTAYVNGVSLLHASDATFTSGAIGFEANSPVQFGDVQVATMAAA